MLFFFQTLVAWRRFILVFGLVAAVAMGVVSFLLPSWYTAVTSVFPPEPTLSMPMYSQVVQQLSAPLLGPVATGAAPQTIYIEMLKSRAVCGKVIDEFGLMKLYKARNVEEALDQIHSHMGFTLQDNGLLILTFEDRDPERAAQIANRLVALLDQTTRELKATSAGRTREFIQRQLTEREEMLAQAETDLKDFQQKYDAVDLDQQLKSAMDIITTLSARAISLESEMQIMSHYTATNSDEYQRKKNEYDEVLAQLKKLKAHSQSSDADMVRSFLPTLKDIPDVALQYVRLKRPVEVQTTVYTMLVNEFEKARIDEARDTPVIQILDHADKPNVRSRPKRKILVIVGGLIGLGWGSLIALFTSAWREDRSYAVAVRQLLRPLAADFSRLRRRRQP